MSAAPPGEGELDQGAVDNAQAHADEQDSDLEQPVLVPPRGLVWVTLAALSATAAVAILFAPPVVAVDPPSLELAGWQGSEGELSDMRQRIAALLRLAPQAEAQELAMRGEFALWLAQEATQGQLAVEHDFAARLHLARAEEHARQLVLARGPDALQAAAARYGLEVREALEEALRAPTAAGQGLPVAPRLDQIAPGMRASLLGTGIERHLRAGSLLPAAQLVVEALAAQRVLALGARISPRPTLPSDQQALLLRWRVEAHEGLSAERRAQLLAQLESSDPGYPGEFTAGVWAARSGDCSGAVALWQRSVARRQMMSQSRANIRWCEAKLAAER